MHGAVGSTFFQTEDWPMKDFADSVNGWSVSEVRDISCPPAASDIYAELKLFPVENCLIHSMIFPDNEALNSVPILISTQRSCLIMSR